MTFHKGPGSAEQASPEKTMQAHFVRFFYGSEAQAIRVAIRRLSEETK